MKLFTSFASAIVGARDKKQSGSSPREFSIVIHAFLRAAFFSFSWTEISEASGACRRLTHFVTSTAMTIAATMMMMMRTATPKVSPHVSQNHPPFHAPQPAVGKLTNDPQANPLLLTRRTCTLDRSVQLRIPLLDVGLHLLRLVIDPLHDSVLLHH